MRRLCKLSTLCLQMGQKDSLGWASPGSVLEMQPVSPMRSQDILIMSAERINGTDSAPPGSASFITARAPLMDGIARNWLYLTWRGAYNPSIINGVSLHIVPFDFDIFGDPAVQQTGVMGPPNLLDVVPYTQDQVRGIEAPVRDHLGSILGAGLPFEISVSVILSK